MTIPWMPFWGTWSGWRYRCDADGIFSAQALGGSGLGDGNTTIAGQLVAQFVAVAATIVYSGILSFIILKAVDAIVGLRVSEEEEIAGLDISLHDEKGYNF